MKDDIVLMSLIFLTLIVPFAIGYIFISYTKSLENEKCACSADLRRKYIKYYGYFLIVSSLACLATVIIYVKYPPFRKLKSLLKIVILAIQFLSAYVIFTYSKYLQDNECKCADSWKRVFIKYYGYGITIFLGLLFFCLVMAFLILISTGNSSFILELKKYLLGCQM